MKKSNKKRKLSDFTPKELKEMPFEESTNLFADAIVQNLKQVNTIDKPKEDKIRTIDDTPPMPDEIKNLSFNYQPEITKELDNLDDDFDQNIINQIVLWKINRYAKIDDSTLQLINKIKKSDREFNMELTGEILLKLLSKNQKGIRLPMASAILRFRNCHIYPIIDQRAYRYAMGRDLKFNLNDLNIQIEIYYEYIQKLKQKCNELNIDFCRVDRVLYSMDKKFNPEIRLRGY